MARDRAFERPLLLAWWGRSSHVRPILSRVRPILSRVSTTLVAGALLWIAFAFAVPHFLTAENLRNVLIQSSNLAILAAGVTVVIATAEIDLSVGSLQALSTTLAGVLIIEHRVPIGFGIAAIVALGILSGVIAAALTLWLRIPSLIATLALLSVWSGVGLLISGGGSIYGFPESYGSIARGEIAGVPVPVLIALAVYAALSYVVRLTEFGVNVEAVGGNAEASRRAGIRPGRVKLQALALGGICSALAGLVLSSRLDAGNPTFGAMDILDAISAVVIGGTSLFGGRIRLWGTFIGVLILASIRNGLNLINVTPYWQPIAVGAILIFAVGVDQLTRGLVRA